MLLKGGCVLSLDRQVGNLRDADVLVEAGEVVEVGRGLRSRDAEVIDASDHVVLPGFVDAHRHLWRTLLRNTGGSGVDPASLAAQRSRLDADDVYAGTLLGLLTAAQTGITTVADWADLPDAACTDAALQAHHDAGLRTVLIHAPPHTSDTEDAAGLRGLVARARGVQAVAAGRTTLAFGAVPRSAGSEHATTTWALARELGLRIHAHTSRPGLVAQWGTQAQLGADVTLVHGSELAANDLAAAAEHGAAIAVTPARGMVDGLGPPPVQQLIDHDLRPGLGVGDELATPGDVFTQMRIVQSLQRGDVFDRKLAGKAGLPDLLSTREVIRYATIDGARALGLAEVTGTLTPGKRADILVLRADRANIAPVNDPIGAVVWGMDTSNVAWVFVAGEALVREGALTADIPRVRSLAVAAHTRLASTRGDLLGTSDGGPR